ARRQSRDPDGLEGLLAHSQRRAYAEDGQEFRINHVQEIPRREAVRRIENVGPAPADELLADIDREAAPGEGAGQAANCGPRATEAAIIEIARPFPPALIL